jgi:hypothetical protein
MAGSRPGSSPRWWRYLVTQESVDVRLRYDPIQPFQLRPRPATALVSAIVRTMLGLCHLAFRFEFVGSIPAEGCVLVSSHVSYLDGLLPTMLSGRVTPIISRHCKPQPSAGRSARDWLLRIGKTIRAYALTIYGVIWAEGGSSITQGAAVVSAGQICWLAPKGFGRAPHGTYFSTAQLGAARIALMENCPVVPIAIVSRRRTIFQPRPMVVVRIGQPIGPDPAERGRHFTDRYMAALDLLNIPAG